MILDFANKWKPGDILGVRFFNGTAGLHARVEEAAKIWENYANIKFDFTGNSNNIIRIKFNEGKNDSKVGTDALTYADNMETMTYANIHENSRDADLRQVVLHEFGHALGLLHEHFHPNSSINLNRNKTINHFMNAYGFSEADVEHNLLRKYCINQLSCSEFDPDSIMIYNIPSDCTDDGKEYQQQIRLSEIDKLFISKVYPFEEEQPIAAELDRTLVFELPTFYDEIVYKINADPNEDKRYYIETNSTEDITLCLFRIENKGERKGYIEYLEPFDNNNETTGKNAKIELEEYVVKFHPDNTEYFVRIRLKNAERTTGQIKVFKV
jgi:hypothetical protein